jgi:UDP-N-acetylglucosamine acyltransferase
MLAMGEPLRYGGLNRVGLTRRGFKEETLTVIKKAYHFIYQSKLTIDQAIQKIENELYPAEEIKHIVDFIKQSKRGIIR